MTDSALFIIAAAIFWQTENRNRQDAVISLTLCATCLIVGVVTGILHLAYY